MNKKLFGLILLSTIMGQAQFMTPTLIAPPTMMEEAKEMKEETKEVDAFSFYEDKKFLKAIMVKEVTRDAAPPFIKSSADVGLAANSKEAKRWDNNAKKINKIIPRLFKMEPKLEKTKADIKKLKAEVNKRLDQLIKCKEHKLMKYKNKIKRSTNNLYVIHEERPKEITKPIEEEGKVIKKIPVYFKRIRRKR